MDNIHKIPGVGEVNDILRIHGTSPDYCAKTANQNYRGVCMHLLWNTGSNAVWGNIMENN